MIIINIMLNRIFKKLGETINASPFTIIIMATTTILIIQSIVNFLQYSF